MLNMEFEQNVKYGSNLIPPPPSTLVRGYNYWSYCKKEKFLLTGRWQNNDEQNIHVVSPTPYIPRVIQ